MRTAIKPSSTNHRNKVEAISKCPVTLTLDKIGGRWKPLILYALAKGTLRYNEVKKAIPLISEKMLIQQLRELEHDKLVARKVYPVVPPHVEYSLSKTGQEMQPILMAMAQWGLKHG